MNIDFNEIVQQKLAQMEAEGVIQKKIEAAVSGVLVQRYEGIKLSDIFKRYREHVMDSTDDSEKEDRQEFTMELEISEGYTGSSTYYTCKFCPEPEYDADDYDAVEVRFYQYRNEQTAPIRSLTIGGLDMPKTLKFGCLDQFDQFVQFVVNLFLNKTEIILDADAAEDAAEDNAYLDY